uniref:Uncharacterized protein n=1 Tax=Anguilla anguilla TaxID=7936 RepID=A0A0E9SNG0_ANGAN
MSIFTKNQLSVYHDRNPTHNQLVQLPILLHWKTRNTLNTVQWLNLLTEYISLDKHQLLATIKSHNSEITGNHSLIT